ncbi:class I SAM-dependent methyltransferase [Segetibacter sp.]|jgi:predicted O-methyltransferase YrrM|uniref:O-methyltransferase n=1 Tax=Segetibacter sp. TaxID=2231182 RepID=UPI00261DEA7E|nr:class I SAM-dependent methyltransferase [Segetibacter sp.]MCW3081921.1 Methyltransferase domain protein [Segetibacter sp.]
MYSALKLATKYLSYYFTASNGKGHGVHSPFVFNFITNVLNDRRTFYAYEELETLRQDLISDNRQLTIEDFGAGSAVTKSNERKVKNIAGSALKHKKYGQLMFRMVDYYKANTIVELGTSLGITTGYLASANLKGQVYTLEGARQVAEVAKQNFKKLSLENIQVVEGSFDDTLQPLLDKINKVDFAFIDGNHRREPTVRYFEQLLSKASENSVFVFDDIHWSEGMEDAWTSIKQHASVTLTIDLFFIGIVFFRKEQKVAQHFSIRF